MKEICQNRGNPTYRWLEHSGYLYRYNTQSKRLRRYSEPLTEDNKIKAGGEWWLIAASIEWDQIESHLSRYSFIMEGLKAVGEAYDRICSTTT